ncbi:MAG TPA: SDR family NAD(P)-dependent oxidoreductase [Hyphomicrobiales bacterium]|nr:SDR family NAD(P)-dependent oxidoreductase [Hyphomicrobiales bacterium]
MEDLAGKVAVVTGAASGIGLGCARTFARAGMAVALLDVRGDALAQATAEVEALGVPTLGIETDVSRKDSVEAAAARIDREFGKVHVVMNNAGVVLRGIPMDEVTDDAWNWVLGVNLFGAIHGVQAFVPRIRAHGEGGHVVNTASMAGLFVSHRETGVYAASKFAVVAFSEALAYDLRNTGIGVSILAPAAVATAIYANSAVARGARWGDNPYAETPDEIAAGLTPDEVGRRVLAAIRDGRRYIITHPETRSWIEGRHAALMADYDRGEADAAAG